MLSHDWSSNGCFDVTIGSVQLSVPRQYTDESIEDGSVNLFFKFNSEMPGVDCQGWCKTLFVNISSTWPTPERLWKNVKPEFTGHSDGKYRFYLERHVLRSSAPPWQVILVPMDVERPQDEFYFCDLERQGRNALCQITILTKSGLTASFSIRRKSLIKMRDAASFVTQTINQFSENHTKGICK